MIGLIVTIIVWALITLSLWVLEEALRSSRPKKLSTATSDPITVHKPWGKEIIWAQTPKYLGKILCINAGHQLSKQYHKIKDETLYLLSGEMKLELGEEGKISTMKAGDCIRIEPWMIHRMIAITDCQVAEVSTPEIWDVVRLEDSYGRA